MVLRLVIAACVLSVPIAADAQSAKMHRIGYLGSSSATVGFHIAFRDGLREAGWAEGQNVQIEYRFAGDNADRLARMAAELVRLKVDLIVAQPTRAAVAAKKATATIPIVMVNAGDPDRIGLVASLAQPGGNVTGTAFSVGLTTIVKGLELLKEAIPGLRVVAVLSNPANPAESNAIEGLRKAAKNLELQLEHVRVIGPEQFDRAFAEMRGKRAEALLVVAEALFIVHASEIANLALKNRLPSMHGVREGTEAGGLMSYGPSLRQSSRRAATFADKILRGAKPSELPVEQPTRFELVVNRRTAKELAATIPQSFLVRADAVID
ncbi:MAG TPA: ABC transporter substrate-binding protein [Burkholderiales bacterium]|nr:ABC transporter substrate-binding protein [Burkholderiales bacterium]